ncbi:MAG: hypothetical protein ACTSRZ_00505 [Promethearchaeota archaeon]
MKHFLNTLLHFNLQFVAGEKNTYDKLCLEAYEPFLDLLIECPKWHADLEISGYMLEYIQENLPFLNDKLKKLNKKGQLDVICVHYSESFYLAYPYTDFKRSWSFDVEIMEKIGLKFSSTFFAQENCFGEGLSYVKDGFGIKTAVIPEKNYNWLYGDLKPLYPVYDMNGLNVIIRGGGNQPRYEDRYLFDAEGEDKKISWGYTKCGDGEPFLADDPYINFKFNQNKWDQKLELYDKAIENGVQFTTTAEFVAEIEKLGIKKPKLSSITDGPWGLGKPGVYQWMGFYFSYYELDAEIMSLNFRARTILLMAEFLVNYTKEQIKEGGLENFSAKYLKRLDYLLKRGWKFLATAQVSDSTGWVPTLNEVWFSVDYSLSAFYLGERIIKELVKQLSRSLGISIEAIDLYNQRIISRDNDNNSKLKNLIKEDPVIRRVLSAQKFINEELREKYQKDPMKRNILSEILFEEITPICNKDDLPEEIKQLEIKCIGSGGSGIASINASSTSERWIKLDENCWRAEFCFIQNEIKTGIQLDFFDDQFLIYSPSLLDDKLIKHDYSKWRCPYLFLPLPNGLVNIGNGFWIIKHNDQNHIAPKIDFENKKIEFLLETNLMALGGREQLDIDVEQNWAFTIFKGSETEALELARAINITPIKPINYPKWIYGGNILAPWTRFTRMVTK